MIKKTIVALLLILCSMELSSYSQVMITAGYDRVFSGRSQFAVYPKDAIFVGADYSFCIVKGLALQCGVRLSSASQTKESRFQSDVHHQFRLDELMVPFMLSYGLDISPSLRMGCFAGPEYSCILKHQWKMVFAGAEPYIDETDLRDHPSYGQESVYGYVGAFAELRRRFRLTIGSRFGEFMGINKKPGNPNICSVSLSVSYMFSSWHKDATEQY